MGHLRSQSLCVGRLQRVVGVLLFVLVTSTSTSGQEPTKKCHPHRLRVTDSDAEQLLYRADSGVSNTSRTIELCVRDTLSIVLASRPATGTSWLVASNDGNGLRALGSRVLDDSDGSAAQLKVFEFLAQQAGRSVLTMQLKRPFDRAAPPIATLRLDVLTR